MPPVMLYSIRPNCVNPRLPPSHTTYAERQRLFQLLRSGWDDYNREKISAGGGVYLRTAKAITISPEVQNLLGVKKERLEPNALIRAILKSPVDLIWNGGIGTYVKATAWYPGVIGTRPD